MIEDKYELLTQIAKVLDERDHLRSENDILEKRMHDYKVASGSGGALPAGMLKVYEFGVRELFRKCFSPGWYNIGVKEVDGEPKPGQTPDEWFEDIYNSGHLPKDFSMGEVFEVCKLEMQRAYEKKWLEEVEEWKAEKEGDGDDDE